MKMNKLAAGALALALGLGAVAPAVAAETKFKSSELTLERHSVYEEAANKAYKKFLDAELKYNAAKKEFDAAEADRKAKEAKFFSLYPEAKQVYDKYKIVEEFANVELKLAKEAAKELNALTVGAHKVDPDGENGDIEKAKTKSAEALIAEIKAWLTKAPNVEQHVYDTAVASYVNRCAEYSTKRESKADKQEAYMDLVAAQKRVDIAKLRLDKAKAAYVTAEKAYEDALKVAKDWAHYFGYTVQAGNNGVQIVKPGDAQVKKATKEYSLADLREARENAKRSIEAVKILKKIAPKKLVGVEDKVNKLVEECEKLIKLADKYLAPKAAFVATAYADEEKTPSIDELTKQLNEKSDQIQDAISDKKEEAPVEEEKKPEEKKPEENKPSRRAGNNARTGIAGIAGVAGILAAASVAYAASKRD